MADDDLEFDFFDDEETAEVLAQRASGPDPDTVKRRRVVAAGGIGGTLLLILVVVLLTQGSSDQSGSYRAYVKRMSPIAADSVLTGRLLRRLMADMRSGAATNPLLTLGSLATRARRDLARAAAIRPPAELRTAQEQALASLDFRV